MDVNNGIDPSVSAQKNDFMYKLNTISVPTIAIKPSLSLDDDEWFSLFQLIRSVMDKYEEKTNVPCIVDIQDELDQANPFDEDLDVGNLSAFED